MKTRLTIVSALLVCATAAPRTAIPADIDGAVHLGCSADVRALLHTDGTLWIGTSGGLYRYDLGSDEFDGTIAVGDRLPSNSVRALCARGDSVLVGTDAGLAVYNGTDASVYTRGNRAGYDSLSFDLIRSIDVGRADRIYFGTYGDGVGVMQGRYGHMITRRDSLLDDKVYGVLETADDARYFATSMGLCAYRDSAWVGFQAGAGIPRGEVRALLDAGDGRMDLLVGVGGVYRFDGERARRLSPEGVFDGNDIAALTVDERGALWAAGRFGGIATYQGGRWTRVGDGDAEVDAAPWRCAYADGDGGVFFGSADGLVAMMRDNVLRKIHLPDGLPSGSVRSIAMAGGEVFFLDGPHVVRATSLLSSAEVEDAPGGLACLAGAPDSTLWGAGRWGVFERRGGVYREFRDVTGGADPAFTALSVDARGWVWTALRNGAVYRYDGGLWVRVAEPDELFDGPVDGLVSGPRGLWAFQRAGGVARFDRVSWTRYGLGSFGDSPVRDLATSAQGAVVAATSTRLWLFRDDAQTWQPVEVSSGGGDGSAREFVAPRTHSINRVTFDVDGNMYLGTDGGLGIVGAEGVRWLGAGEGLGGRAIIDVFVDGRNSVWLGFRADGVTRIPMKTLW